MNKPRIILADDHNIVRSGMAALLSQDGRYEVVAQATNGEEALERASEFPAEVMLVDLAMPRLGGLEVIQRLRKTNGRIRLLVLSMYDDAQFVARAIRAGANGYLLKQAMDEELFDALESVLDGIEYVSRAIDASAVLEFTFDDLDLTAREREVLQLIADGMTNTDIATTLFISPHTATRHRANLMRKLNVHNRVDLIRAAIQQGLIVITPAGIGGQDSGAP